MDAAAGTEGELGVLNLNVCLWPMLLKKAKMNRSNFFPVRPSKPVFRIKRVPMTLRRLPVENWIGYLSPYIIFGLEHRCLGKNLFDPRKTLFNIIGPKADLEPLLSLGRPYDDSVTTQVVTVPSFPILK
jgi:hypothetical protein